MHIPFNIPWDEHQRQTMRGEMLQRVVRLRQIRLRSEKRSIPRDAADAPQDSLAEDAIASQALTARSSASQRTKNRLLSYSD